MNTKTILWMSKDFNNASGACRLMEKSGFRVIREADVHAMLFLLATNVDVDLTVIDVRNTDAHAQDYVHSVKRIAPHIPVIVMTSQGTVMQYLQCLSLGAYEYVQKPIKDYEFLRIVRAATDVSINSNLPAQLHKFVRLRDTLLRMKEELP